jgi:hypothetical protein
VNLIWAFVVWLICLAIFAWLHARMVRRGDASPISPVTWAGVVAVSSLVWAVMLLYALS